jgi:hypothetical protein
MIPPSYLRRIDIQKMVLSLHENTQGWLAWINIERRESSQWHASAGKPIAPQRGKVLKVWDGGGREGTDGVGLARMESMSDAMTGAC